jgi:hypothetical protein
MQRTEKTERFVLKCFVERKITPSGQKEKNDQNEKE